MRLQHIAEQIYHQPWLITATGHRSVQNLFESKLAKVCQFKADDDADEYDSPFIVQREKPSLDANSVGHVYIRGVVGQGLSKIEKSCGNTDCKDITAEIKALVEQGAKGILLCIDSPGGMVTGTPELAEFISNVALEIPVYVYCDSQLCSAAYWLAAGVTRILSTDSAEVGSIGVYFPWVDSSGAWEKQGLKSEPVVNDGGIFKGVGLGPSLTPEQREELQAKVNRIFGLFKSFVTTMRALNGAVVPDDACQGQTFLGVDAFSNGLVDQIVSCEDEAYFALVDAINGDTDLDEDADIDFEFPTE
jgi:signal peptide peptidase SppA